MLLMKVEDVEAAVARAGLLIRDPPPFGGGDKQSSTGHTFFIPTSYQPSLSSYATPNSS